MKPNEKRTQNLYNTLYYSGNVEEQFENIIKDCEQNHYKYKDPNFYPQKSLIEEDKEMLSDHRWKRLENQYPLSLFDNVKPESIQQGSLGDCYFIVGLIYASHDIELVKSLFHPKSSLKYGVVLVYLWFLGERIPVIVDTQVAYFDEHSTTPSFSHPRTDEDSCWFVLVEKAYAKACGGYSIIESGKSSFGIHLMFDYFSTIFNPISDIIPVRSLEEAEKEITDKNNKIFNILKDSLKEKAMIGTGTPEEYSESFKESIGLINSHAYIILDLNDSKNKQLIKLRNPWGISKYKGPYSIESTEWTNSLKNELIFSEDDDGSFWMPFDDFLRYFVDVNYSLKKEIKWKETSVFGKIEGYLDGRSPCADSPNVGCIPQWKIKFSQKTVVRISYDFSGPVSFHSIYICENHGQKVNALDVQTKMMRSTSKQAVNGIEYNVENYKEPLTFFFTRTEARDEPCYFRILIQSPDTYFKIKKFDDDFIKEKWYNITETGFFTEDENDQWDPYHDERPLSTCRQYYIYFPDLKYDDDAEVRFRVYKNITESSFYLFFDRSSKRISYSYKGSESYEIYSKSNYEEFSIPINRMHLSNNRSNDSFHYVFSFYRKNLNDVNQFKFSVLSKSRFKFGRMPEPDKTDWCYQIKGKLKHDENDDASPYQGSVLKLKQWCLLFKEPTTLFIEFFSNNTASEHSIYIQKVETKGQKIGTFLRNSVHFDFDIRKNCVHDLKDFEIEDHSKPYALCITRHKADSSSEFVLNISADEEFHIFEINEDGLGKKVDKFNGKIIEKPDFDFPEVKFVDQPINFTPKKYNSKLKISTILQYNSKYIPSNYILKEISSQLKSSNPEKMEYFNIEENHKFDLKFKLPNGKTVTIKNYNKMSFNEIFDSFHKEGFYFSESCIKNNFYLLPEEDKINGEFYEELEMNDLYSKTVTLKYGQMHFIFLENESACEAYNLIRKAFEDSELVTILDDENKKLKYIHELKTNKNYTIHVQYQIKFQFIDGSFSTQYIDYLDTVSDARNLLAPLFNTKDEQLSPEYVIIFDQHKRRIYDYDMMLKDIQNLHKLFYYAVDYNKRELDKLKALRKEKQEKLEESKQNEEVNLNLISQNDEKETKQNEKEKEEEDFNQSKNKEKSNQTIITKTEESDDSLSFINHEKQSKQSQTPKKKLHHTSNSKIPNTEPKHTKKKKRKLLNSPNKEEHKYKIQKQPQEKQCLTIILVCDNCNEKFFNPIEKNLPIDTKISEILEMIAYEFFLPKDQMIMKYKEKKTKIKIDPDKTIGDIREKMIERQYNGICRNYLYYDFGNSFEINFNYTNTLNKTSIKEYQDKLSNSHRFQYYNNNKKYTPKIIKSPKLKHECKFHMRREKNYLTDLFSFQKSKPLHVEFDQEKSDEFLELSNKPYFTFIYEDREIEISFPIDDLLLNTESILKKMFKIDQNEEIEFFAIKDFGVESIIEKTNTSMDLLINEKIKIYLQKNVKKPTLQYYYTINNENTILEIELDPDATIKTMKKEIAKLNHVKKLSRIKIFYNGEEVPDRVYLDFLEAEEDKFLVLIEEKEIFLITEPVQDSTEELIEEEEEP